MNKSAVLRRLCFTLFALFSASLFAAEIVDKQEVTLSVDQDFAQMKVHIAVTLNDVESDIPLRFVLNDSASELQIKRKGKDLAFKFEKDNKPNIFFDGGLLTIAPDSFSDGQLIEFDYLLDIPSINYWTEENRSPGISAKDGLETGMYAAWLPTELSNGKFNYTVTVNSPEDYKVLGNGAISQLANGQWRIESNNRLFDTPIIISRRLQTETYPLGDSIVEVSHFGKSKAELDEIAKDIDTILALFSEKFGRPEQAGTMKFAFVPRDDVASYSRQGFVAINTAGSQMGKFSKIAHEIGHFWWAGADSSLWEDWLNESFAEYSALMAIENKYGKDVFVDRVERFKESANNTPAIWGIDRASDVATLVLYRKGPVILEEARARLGDEKFFSFLRSLIQLEDKNTENLLNELARLSNNNDREWLVEQLKR